jgi:hypothetical protein
MGLIPQDAELVASFKLRVDEPKGIGTVAQDGPEETVCAIKEQGRLVYLEHPYDTGRRNMRVEAIERIASEIDIVEVFNGRSLPDINRKAEDLRATLLVPAGAGSDAHRLEEIGRSTLSWSPFLGRPTSSPSCVMAGSSLGVPVWAIALDGCLGRKCGANRPGQ